MNFHKDTIKSKKLFSFLLYYYHISFLWHQIPSKCWYVRYTIFTIYSYIWLSSLYVIIIYICVYIYIYIYLSLFVELVVHYIFFLTECCWDMKTSNGFSKFISMKKFHYKYHQTAVIIHLEIICLYCLQIILLILISGLKLNETK